MSTAIAKNFQVGSDSTATNNFTIRQPATPDGTVRIANGNSGTTTDLVTVTSAGNVGVGVTPSAWEASAALQVTNNYSYSKYGMGRNYYYDGSSNRYITSAAAGTYQISGGGSHVWSIAPSGTAGNAISFTQAMTLDASGNLGIGETSPGFRIDIKGSSFSSFLQAQNSTSTHKAIYGVDSGGGVDGAVAGSFSNHAFILRTNNTERARITSGGDVGIGTSSPGAKLEVNGSLRANSSLSAGGVFIVASGSFNNSSVNNIGVFSESHIIIHIATGSNKLSSIPVYPNGGAGIAYVYNYMNPATAAWTNTGGSDLNFTFSCAGSSANTYNVILTAGSGTLTVQRTAGSAAYAVYVQRIASL